MILPQYLLNYHGPETHTGGKQNNSDTSNPIFFSQRLQLLDDGREHKIFDYKFVDSSKLNRIYVKAITSLCTVIKLTKPA